MPHSVRVYKYLCELQTEEVVKRGNPQLHIFSAFVTGGAVAAPGVFPGGFFGATDAVLLPELEREIRGAVTAANHACQLLPLAERF